MDSLYTHSRYGFFVHYILCDCYYKDGTKPATIDEAADNFDVPSFVADIKAMGVEYIIITSWHFRMLPLYPSAVTEAIRPGCSAKRDLLGEIIDAIKAAGVGVILYTHPRDGHDFVGQERIDSGWGEGWRVDGSGEHKSVPNPASFNYEKWNNYVQALYQELLDRYGDRIDGVYTDGGGPMRLASNWTVYYNEPVVDYLGIRRKIKSHKGLVMIQNGFGCEFNDDYVMPEGYFGYENTHPDIFTWPATEKAMAMQPFSGWAASGKYGEDLCWLSGADIARFTIFEASCAAAGGMCWAAGPYCGGGWDVGVLERMREAARHLSRLAEGWKDNVPSPSWPTVSGDTLDARGGVFAATSRDKRREYIHVMRLPEDGMVKLPCPADGVKLSAPRVVGCDAAVINFVQDGDGVRFHIIGRTDEIDTVVCFDRENDLTAPLWFWFNCTDKRIRYTSILQWHYHNLGEGYNATEATHRMLGCYEYDTRTAQAGGARLDTWFEGSEVEVYASIDPSGGRADFLVDDMLVASLDSRAPLRKNRVRLATSGELGGGVHTVSLIARDPGFEFDALRIRK